MLPTRLTIFLLLSAAGTLAFPAEQKPGKGKDDKNEPPKVVPEPPAPKEFARKEVLLSVEDLRKLLTAREGKLVVIDARDQEHYLQGHIPGARNIPSDQFQDTEHGPHYLASVQTVKTACAETGINADSRVVIYDEDDGRLAARLWFTLHAYGHDNIALLNGGAGKWKEAKQPWTDQLPPRANPGSFEPAAGLRGVCVFTELSQFRTRVHTLGKLPPTTLIDARSQAEYMGEEARGKIAGHMPGAANIEWSALLTGPERARVWRSPTEIHAILRLAGLEREQKIAVYDQAGGRSAHLYFTLWLMGFDKVCNYVAGWREYGNREDVEVER